MLCDASMQIYTPIWSFFLLYDASIPNVLNVFSLLHVQGSYMAKVKQLARIKQKQDEDKAATRLHSFKYVSNEFMVDSHKHISLSLLFG